MIDRSAASHVALSSVHPQLLYFFPFLFHSKPTVEQTVKLMLGNKGSFCSHPSIPPINMSVMERKKELAKTVKMNSVSDLRC
jgi:hypothetical protein